MSNDTGTRVAVFIDYQNCYGWARRAFHDARRDPPACGHVHPRALADLLVALGGPARTCSYAGVYVGMPSQDLDPRTASARAKQAASWAASGVVVVGRPLRYPRHWPAAPPMEKGVDVKMALDAVVMAIANEYDVAVLATCDGDLLPLVEALMALRTLAGRPRAVEVIRWGRAGYRLNVKGARLTAHQILRHQYDRIQDLTTYSN